MCRMIAKVSSSADSILEEMYLCPVSLNYLSENGRQPDAPWIRGAHNDGCGMAFEKDGAIEIHKRDKDHAWDESYRSIVQKARSRIFIAHNRLASKGLNLTIESSHPFFYQPVDTPYALSHNGGVKTFMDEAKERGTSDSKILLEKIVDEKEKNPGYRIEEVITRLAKEVQYNSLCAFLITPQALHAWRIYDDSDSELAKRYEDYYTLYLSLRDGTALLSSEPLDEGNWQLLPNNSFLTLKPATHSIEISYAALVI